MHNFLSTPKRTLKPRAYGITSLIDNGVPARLFLPQTFIITSLLRRFMLDSALPPCQADFLNLH